MWNKFILLFSFLFLVYTGGTAATKIGKFPAYQQIKTNEPNIDTESLDDLLLEIRTVFIDNQWPDNVFYASKRPNQKGKRMLYLQDVKVLKKKLEEYIANPDLEEGTRTRRSWYQQISRFLEQEQRLVAALAEAVMNQNGQYFSEAKKRLTRNGDILKKILDHPVKISEKEYQKLREVNSRRRAKERARLYQEYLRTKGNRR